MGTRGPRTPRLLRRLAHRLIAGPDAPFVLDDLDELFARDLARGVPPWRARLRYARNMLGSAVSTRRPRRSRGGGGGGGTVSWLDVKLGLRMLVRYPGLAAVGVLAMSLGIALGAAYLEVVHDVLNPDLPLAEGERVVGIRVRDVETSTRALPSLDDLVRWRGTLETVRELGAFRTVERNLIPAPGAPAEPVEVAEITPAGFGVPRVPPALGRALVEADGRPGASPVVVLGHRAWLRRFGGDPGVLGRTVGLGDDEATVVGVMPEGFAFPMSHEAWIPLRVGAAPTAAGGGDGQDGGPRVRVFGRLAPGVTVEQADAEVEAVGRRTAADLPATHGRLRPRVVPYTDLFFGGGISPRLYWVEVVFVLLLGLIAANVATLVFARTATRDAEIAVRSALGASRARIVTQLFVEALVLALLAAVVALAVVRWLTGWLVGMFWAALGGAPFWWDPGLSLDTVGASLALAALAAVVIGVLPALRTGGTDLREALQRAATRGSSLRLGRVWTVSLVLQVAVSVALLPAGVDVVWRWAQTEAGGPGFPADEYLAARLEMDGGALPAAEGQGAAGPERFAGALAELERRLEEEPGVLAVTFATALPRTTHPTRRVEVEGLDATETAPPSVGMEIVEPGQGSAGGPTAEVAFVAPDFFEALGATVVSGRTFIRGAGTSAERPAVVNRAFVQRFLDGRNAVGRRVRFDTRPGEQAAPWGANEPPWFEVVGVVADLATDRRGLDPSTPPALYLPLTPAATAEGRGHVVRAAVHLRGAPAAFAPRLREIATGVDPALRLYDPLPLESPPILERGVRAVNEILAGAIALVVLSALLVSASGTYSLMSFTVSRRTREIGIRAALGADPRRLVWGIFSGALWKLALGVALGAVVWFVVPFALLDSAGAGGLDTGRAVGVLAVVSAVMLLVGLLACGVPARRALRVEPTEALREA